MKKGFIILLASFSVFAFAQESEVDCENAINTLELNQCAAMELTAAEQEMQNYLKVSFEHNAYDPELIEAIKSAQKNWQVYMTSHCDSIYTQWRQGSIRGVMSISCKTKLTKQRTHEIWENFLTYMDSTPPVLPEPNLD